ncbi:hypothetical protein CgunFtcFv8_011128 [Champsocephalus gunnari]|uniref:Uncharacterized protein n=1 Tax=Champsocephalus gunnari TaxID=52237 RepID=A0AAN8E1T1_CHAGU|nr:hypothetical protein CgunFtcFv8_011128 [Champsocephalus gunnari]
MLGFRLSGPCRLSGPVPPLWPGAASLARCRLSGRPSAASLAGPVPPLWPAQCRLSGRPSAASLARCRLSACPTQLEPLTEQPRCLKVTGPL